MNQDFKNKADALKYAIEFTSEDGKPNYKAAQELFDFITKNLALSEDAINLARLHTQMRMNEIAMHANACFNSLLGYNCKPRCSVETKEQAHPIPDSSCICKESYYIKKLLHQRGYIYIRRLSSDGSCKKVFRFEDDREIVDIAIEIKNKVVVSPQPDTNVIDDKVMEITKIRDYLLERGYINTVGSNEPETFVHPKLNIKIAFV